MGNFNRDNHSNNGRNFDRPSFNSRRPDMHKATCSNCGRICEVPFKPTGNKPVFCKECFAKNGNAEPRRSDDREMFSAVCAKCGTHCKVPFRPTSGRDVLCSACFGSNESSESRRPDDRRSFDKPSFNRDDNRGKTYDTPNYKAQFEALNAKMDKILSILTATPKEVMPLDSAIDKKVIEEIAEEVTEVKEAAVEKKTKKISELVKKPTATKTKKAASSKKK